MKKAFSILYIAMILASVSGCSFLFSTKAENVQYIPESIKDMPKESLAEIHIKGTIINRPITRIDDVYINYPVRGALIEMWTLGLTNHDLCIYVTEGWHRFPRKYLHSYYFHESQYLTFGSYGKYQVTQPGIVPSEFVGERYKQEWIVGKGYFYMKKGEKRAWEDIKKYKYKTENTNLDEQEHSIEDQNKAELSIEESSN